MKKIKYYFTKNAGLNTITAALIPLFVEDITTQQSLTQITTSNTGVAALTIVALRVLIASFRK